MRTADLELARRCRDGETGAFDELYRAHAGRLYNLVFRMTGSAQEAEDLLQEVFLHAYRKLASFRGDSSLGTWLYRLTVNQCLDFLRGRQTKMTRATSSLDDDNAVEPAASMPVVPTAVSRIDLERSIARLPDGCRAAFVLHDIEGFEHNEVARLLGVSEGTSKSQVHKARTKLRAMLMQVRVRGPRYEVMNCLDYEHQLGDFVDGTLASVACESLEAHLSTCDRCRALVADFQTIRLAALAMEPAAPPASAWTKIAARIEEESRPWWRFGGTSSTVWQPIAALAMALLLTTSLTWLGSSLAPAAELSRQATTAPAPLADLALDTAEKDYATAIAGLEQITRAERQALDSETADVLQVNLTSIDTAIGESRAALVTEPGNDLAIESLFEALKRKLSLLQDAVALINEMRKGNSEGAARIVSGLNQ